MTRRTKQLLIWLAVAVVVAVGIQTLGAFAWQETWRQLLDTDLILLSAAIAINLSTLVGKGWAWQWLLRPRYPVRWWPTQKANLIGATATNLAGSVVGEAVRARDLVRATGVPWADALGSIIWLRIVEGIGIAIFLVATPIVFRLPEALRNFQIGAAIVLLLAIVFASFGPTRRVGRALPKSWRERLGPLLRTGGARHLIVPTAIVVGNWLTQWVTYYLVIRAVHIEVGWGPAFAALIAANLASLLRLPAGNLGVFQASIAVGLLPFGVKAEDAVAAGIILEAIQVLPVILLGGLLVGVRGLEQLRAQPEVPLEDLPPDDPETPAA